MLSSYFRWPENFNSSVSTEGDDSELDGTGLSGYPSRCAQPGHYQLLPTGRDETGGVTQPQGRLAHVFHKYYGAWFPERGAGASASKVVLCRQGGLGHYPNFD